MILQHNIPALNALRNNGINNAQTSSNLEKLSSGYRINRAADDAAGLAISEKMRSQIRGLGMAEQNTSNAVDLIQTAEGGLNEIHAILHRMRELAVQAANGTYVDDDREQITLEVDALKSEVDRIASSTHFNGINLLDGTLGGVGASIAPGTAGANDPLNSPTAYREGSKPAFAKMLENMGFVSSIDAGLDPEKGAKITGYAALHLYDSSLAGSTANLVITSGSTTGGNAAVALQIGSAIYPAVISDGITPAGTAANQYVFLDDAGTPFAALLHNSSISDAAGPFELLKPTGDSGVINGITLTSPAAVFYNTLTDAGISTVDSALQNVVVAHDGSEIIFQIGANGSADQQVGMHVPLMGTANLGTFTASASNPTGTLAGISVRTREAANEALTVIDVAVAQVSSVRANLGAMQNRLEHTLNNLGVTKENLVAAESTIRDTDMAKEMMEFTKNSILTQASQAMLAQANSLPQGVLSLLS